MRILYILEHPPREVETFVRREIAEVLRQGDEIWTAHRSGADYHVGPLALAPDLAGFAPAGEPRVVPPAGPAATFGEFLGAGAGARAALRHALGPGRALGSGYRQAAALARAARRAGANVIHAHFAARSAEDALLTSRISGIPFAFTVHGYDLHVQPPSDLRERALAAGAVVTVSQFNAQALTTAFEVPANAVRVIPCGVDTRRFTPGEAPTPHLVASVIRLHRDKGPDLLIDAAEELDRRGVDFRLEIAGDGEDRVLIERRLAGPLGEKVRLLGSVDESQVLDLLRRASVFVLPSRRETLGVALIEAMSCGLAAAATGVGGVPETLDGGRCGVLVPPENPAALADGVAQLLRDPERRRALGAAAREQAQRRFDLEQTVGALRALWRAIAAAPRHRPCPASSSAGEPS